MADSVSTAPQVLADGSVWPEDAVEVGRVLDAWGVKGGVKVIPFSAEPQALFCTKKWYLRPAEVSGVATKPGGVKQPASAKPEGPPKLAQPSLFKVKQAREQGDVIVATLDDVDDRNGAEALKGARVFVSRSAFPTPDPDEYYWVDLIGLTVVNRAGEVLGKVVDLLDTGPHCVLRLRPEEGEEGVERMIPFVSAYIDSVSLPERRIVADWGLDY